MISYLTAALLAVIGSAQLTTTRGPRHLVTFFFAMALSLTISAEPTVRIIGVEHVLVCRVVTNMMQVLAVHALMKLARSTRSPEPRTPWWPLVLCWAVMIVSCVDFASAYGVQEMIAFQWRPSVLLYQVALTGYPVGCLVVFVVSLSRDAARRPRGTFRAGLHVIVAAAVATIGWGLFSGLPSVTFAVTGFGVAEFLPVSRNIGLVAMTLWVAGAVLTAWDGAVRLVRTWLGIRAVTPLWKALVAAQPQIALPARHDLEFTLYRRLIEIRDGLLAVRAHVPPNLPDWLRSPVDGPTRAAAELAAALVMRDAGRTWEQQPARQAGEEPSVEAETAWLGAVSSAFTRSPVVREVRRRAPVVVTIRSAVRRASAAIVIDGLDVPSDGMLPQPTA
ncbi:MAB_1171c family putative transporter [Lentzea sp. JNUCC 0626]|uniref:MAB_1171c family putative transporter n=1 Tax=Lentzea sp. JNUCC 0626 TaxID=3367513 RepID=UPI003747D7A3